MEYNTEYATKYICCSYKLNYFASYCKQYKPNWSTEIVSYSCVRFPV